MPSFTAAGSGRLFQRSREYELLALYEFGNILVHALHRHARLSAVAGIEVRTAENNGKGISRQRSRHRAFGMLLIPFVVGNIRHAGGRKRSRRPLGNLEEQGPLPVAYIADRMDSVFINGQIVIIAIDRGRKALGFRIAYARRCGRTRPIRRAEYFFRRIQHAVQSFESSGKRRRRHQQAEKTQRRHPSLHFPSSLNIL